MKSKKVISVCVLTYNQESYISYCLDNILAQKGDFVLEILIGEDGSNDSTSQICQEYANRYPDIIKLFQRSRKDVIFIDGKVTGRYNFTQTLLQAKGDYIAICEGDDYWTNDKKLAILLEMLENDCDAVAAFHNVIYKDEVNNKSWLFHPDGWNYRSTTIDLCKKNFIATASVLFKNPKNKFFFPDWYFKFRAGDWALHLLNSLRGDFLYCNKVMGVYRHQKNGTWSMMTKEDQLLSISKMYNILLSSNEFLDFRTELEQNNDIILDKLNKFKGHNSKSRKIYEKLKLLFKKR